MVNIFANFKSELIYAYIHSFYIKILLENYNSVKESRVRNKNDLCDFIILLALNFIVFFKLNSVCHT